MKEYRIEKAFMFVGNGRNGKSKTLELIKRFVGIENCCSVPLSSMKQDNSSLCELFGMMFNLAGDLNSSDLKETGCFKQTVGRDLLSAHRKFLRDLIFVNYAKHVFACNELPRVYDITDGFWTKWVLLEFPYKFITKEIYNTLKPGEKEKHKILDPQIIDKIATPEEMSGLLNKSLESLHELLKQKDFSYSVGTAAIKDLWIRKSDSFTAFCMDSLEESYSDYVTKKELRKEYNKYCKKHKIKGSSDRGIKANLEDLYGVVESRKTIGNEFDRVWDGIRFKVEVSKI